MGEVHVHDYQISTYATPAISASIVGMDHIANGYGTGDRIGQEIFMKNLEVRFTLRPLVPVENPYLVDQWSADPIRITIGLDHQANEEYGPAFNTVFDGTGYDTFPTLAQQQRFQILYDDVLHPHIPFVCYIHKSTFVAPLDTNASGTTTADEVKWVEPVFHVRIPLELNYKCSYNGDNELTSNPKLFAFVFSQQQYVYEFRSRLTYTE